MSIQYGGSATWTTGGTVLTIAGQDITSWTVDMTISLGSSGKITGDQYRITAVEPSGTTGGTVTVAVALPTYPGSAQSYVLDTRAFTGSAISLLNAVTSTILNAIASMLGAGAVADSNSRVIELAKATSGALSQIVYKIGSTAQFMIEQATVSSVEFFRIRRTTDGSSWLDALTINKSTGAVSIAGALSVTGTLTASVATTRTTRGDSGYTILVTDRLIELITAFTAPRTFILPEANTYTPGVIQQIVDAAGAISSTNTLTIACSGTNTINGASSLVMSAPFKSIQFACDGTSKFTLISALAANDVSTSHIQDAAVTAAKLAPAAVAAAAGHLAGCHLSSNGSSTVTTTAGRAISSLMSMTLASAMAKTLASTWTAGTGNGGLDTGTKANSTWYYWYLIGNPTTGAVDIIASATGPGTGPAMPSGYTARVYLGATVTDGSGNVREFYHYDRHFTYTAPISDFSNAGTSPMTSRVLSTISVPAVPVRAQLQLMTYHSAASNFWLTSPKWTDADPAASSGKSSAYGTTGQYIMTNLIVATDDRQVGWRFQSGTSGHQIYGATQGYDDLERGRAN